MNDMVLTSNLASYHFGISLTVFYWQHLFLNMICFQFKLFHILFRNKRQQCIDHWCVRVTFMQLLISCSTQCSSYLWLCFTRYNNRYTCKYCSIHFFTQKYLFFWFFSSCAYKFYLTFVLLIIPLVFNYSILM